MDLWILVVHTQKNRIKKLLLLNLLQFYHFCHKYLLFVIYILIQLNFCHFRPIITFSKKDIPSQQRIFHQNINRVSPLVTSPPYLRHVLIKN